MTEDMVMRSVYLRPLEDNQLRQLAHDLSVTKSDLIRSAISTKLVEWLQSNSREAILSDLARGKRDEAAIRRGRPPRDKRTVEAAPRRAGAAKPVRARKAAEETSAADSPEKARDALV